MHSSIRRAWVEVDLGALLRNGAAIAAHAGVKIVPMVKADAYGLGAVAVARTLEQLDPWGFGVATIAEGEELRRAAIERPIVVFSPLLIGDFDAAVRANLTPTLGTREAIERWRETGRPWQLSIDTGMNRAGVQWDEIETLRDVIAATPPQAVFTHFHSAERGDDTRDLQERRFAEAIARLATRPLLIHAENGAAVEHRAPSKWGLARPGIFLYGVSSGNAPQIHPEPVVAVRARVIDLRTIAADETVSYGGTYKAPSKRRIATLGIGYADGYRRGLSNRASVLFHGRRARVVGVVTMDMTMIDVTDVQCEIGDIATLIGSDGADRIDVAELAEMGGLSPYEILTGLRGRLPRRYIGGEE
ncbi:MAG TPA: alanine racemase [Gemmatimonadaceae bacterium]|nr:alanine racemase [Gemmatimonadaceae bacterium]